jgi:hypothetical protein
MQTAIGRPIFDSLVLIELVIDKVKGVRTVRFGYVNGKTGRPYGAVAPELGFESRRTRDLMDQLITSLESDAVSILFPDSPTAESKGVANEPSGIADGPEEGDQV